MDRENRKKIIDSYKARRSVGGVFAVVNSVSGKRFVSAATDLQGSRNRFEFSQATGGCAWKPMENDFKTYGKDVFSFEVLEQLKQKEGQSDNDFKNDIDELYAMIIEGMDPAKLY